MFQVFVYGTLLPEQSNHRLIEQYVVHRQHGQVGAILFDNGAFPYAMLSDNHVAVGEWLSFRDEDRQEVMRRLDQLEGYSGEGYANNHYDRVIVKDLVKDVEGWVYMVHPDSPRGKRIAEQYPVIVSGNWTKREKMLYFAYGSCMSADSFLYTCPDARREGVGFLPNHRMMFATNNRRRLDSGVATVVQDKKEKVMGALWQVNDNDHRALRRREGAPYVYSEKWGVARVVLTLQAEMKLEVKMPIFYYTLNVPWVIRRPSEFYLETIKRGKRELKMV